MLGFSCAGKSTYIRHLVTENRRFATATPIYEHMFRTGLCTELRPGDLFHMDISTVRKAPGADCDAQVQDHPLFGKVFEAGHRLSVDVLLAPRSEIRTRIQDRTHLGLGWGNDNVTGTYPCASKLRVLDALCLMQRYQVWQGHLHRNRIRHRFIWSSDERFVTLSGWDEARRILLR
ncbi:hypothetical protein [Thalassovita mangrovi]|uniref:Adenylate kinase n=1 Tax=Thalassovita mangrovi TaxID=2692236 RepID=A0A6L8LJ06_9RHOB|nr:hypothetical protein [Thalassovita mangrovi]MYM56008.1 hypothetical protein [Thalassovita mangrovi]